MASDITPRPNASRRQMFGAAAALLLAAPWTMGEAQANEPDGELLRLCARLERWDRERKRMNREDLDGHDYTDEELDAVLDPWWETVVEITETPARTPEGVRAKAGAVRMAIVGTSGDSCPQVTAMVASLLSDMLGEQVVLPGLDDGA
jgi:hypothetical protein